MSAACRQRFRPLASLRARGSQEPELALGRSTSRVIGVGGAGLGPAPQVPLLRTDSAAARWPLLPVAVDSASTCHASGYTSGLCAPSWLRGSLPRSAERVTPDSANHSASSKCALPALDTAASVSSEGRGSAAVRPAGSAGAGIRRPFRLSRSDASTRSASTKNCSEIQGLIPSLRAVAGSASRGRAGSARVLSRQHQSLRRPCVYLAIVEKTLLIPMVDLRQCAKTPSA